MTNTKILARTLCLIVAVAVSQNVLPLAKAGTITTSSALASYNLKISAKEAVLANPDDPATELAAMWDHPYQRVVDRNLPWIEIINTGQSEIIKFAMSIGDIDFNFSEEQFEMPVFQSDDNPEDITIDAMIAADGNSIMVNFTNFAPGETVRFRVDINDDDPDAFLYPDYRRVLLDTDLDGDNAQVELTFDVGDSNVSLTQTLPNFPAEDLGNFEAKLRPKNVMEAVDVIEIGGQVPEPSSWALAILSLLGACIASRRVCRG